MNQRVGEGKIGGPVYDPEALHDAVDVRFKDFWDSEKHRHYRLEGSPPEQVELYLQRERMFASEVVEGALELAMQHNGPIMALFDIDETLVARIPEMGRNITFIRPSFEPIVDELQRLLGNRISIGLLTSRSQSHLDDELITPNLLKGVIEKVNPDLVISSREDGRNSGVVNEYVEDRRIEEIDKTFAWGPNWWENGYSSSSLNKAFNLHVLTDLHPETAFLVIDDDRIVKDINPTNPRVKGIHVWELMFAF